MQKTRIISFSTIIIFWFFLALFPWQNWFSGLMVLQFLVGFIIYLVPGLLTFLYINEDKNISLRVILGGFIVSIFVTGILGVLARLFHLNFLFIRLVFTFWGTLMLFLYLFKPISFVLRFEKIVWWQAVLFACTVGGVVFFASINEPPLIHDDAFTYNALVYYFQHAPVLDFTFPDSLSRLEIPRFWIAYWPLVEALISGFSGVDGLLIAGSLLPRLLTCFSFMGIYSLGNTLGLPRPIAAVAVLAQGVSLMRLTDQNSQPGFIFFQRLTEDKVVAAFVISIVLIQLAAEYLEKPSVRGLILASIAALAMMFTHPVQFGMTCMIIGLYGLPLFIKHQERSRYFALIGVLAFFVFIPYLFRFGGGEYSKTLSFSLKDVAANDEFVRLGKERVNIIEGTMFYGISSSLTTGLPYKSGLAASIVALFFFLHNKAARYILASFLVLGVSMLPYTGWIIGMFTTPFQLWRLTWLMPFGIAIAFLLWIGHETLQKITHSIKWVEWGWLSTLYYAFSFTFLVFAVIYIRPWTLSNVEKLDLDVVDYYSNYVSTAALMNELDVNSAIIVGGMDAGTNSVIPSLTIKYVPLVFRVESGGRQTKLWNSLMKDDISPEERLSRLKENNVEYLLLRGEPSWVVSLLKEYPDAIAHVFRDGRFSLYHLTY
jgi:hypothetical protein